MRLVTQLVISLPGNVDPTDAEVVLDLAADALRQLLATSLGVGFDDVQIDHTARWALNSDSDTQI